MKTMANKRTGTRSTPPPHVRSVTLSRQTVVCSCAVRKQQKSRKAGKRQSVWRRREREREGERKSKNRANSRELKASPKTNWVIFIGLGHGILAVAEVLIDSRTNGLNAIPKTFIYSPGSTCDRKLCSKCHGDGAV